MFKPLLLLGDVYLVWGYLKVVFRGCVKHVVTLLKSIGLRTHKYLIMVSHAKDKRPWSQGMGAMGSSSFLENLESTVKLLLRSEMWCRGPLVCRLLFFFTDRYWDLPIKHHYTCDAQGLPNKMSEKNLYLSVR